ncbi:uncharacterized protein LOC109417217 [Aedes albopictus]|uniref:Nose resistant-to-fluoxetine protein N-terminal domain-containing protein n=1 Tax=Aedes albopictus TaxID=7160 RepID=A0ABM1Y3N3_AEDAL|nr:uncharacterized protein LOC109417217 [Aedes albopictus]XP_029711189.1 uncharacterized protein LOC109417217 [Aedes albopictus]
MAVCFRLWFLLAVVALVIGCLVASGDGFRLRDSDVDDNQRASVAYAKRKIQGRRGVMEEVKKRAVVDQDDDDDDDDEDDEEGIEDDDDDDEEERAAESKYKFEKVRKSYRLSPVQKKKAAGRKYSYDEEVKSQKIKVRSVRDVIDTDDDDDEDDEDEEDEEEKTIFNLFGLLGSKKNKEDEDDKEKDQVEDKNDDGDDDDDEEDEKESGGLFGWLKDLTSKDSDKEKEDKKQIEVDEDDDEDDDEEDKDEGGMFGWLKKLSDIVDNDDNDRDKDGDNDDDDDDDHDKEKENPLINFVSSLLQSDKEDTSEEIKFPPVGDEDDEDEDDSTEKPKQKKSKDSKIVQLLNASPLNTLFKSDDLPSETPIDTDPKKIKKLQHTSSKVVKQRIEISPEDFESLLLRIPSFVPDYSRLKNNECRRQGQIFQRQLRGKRLWALQMIDASAKVTSGLLRGNANQLGDYDLCTGIATKVKVKEDEQVRMRGKYCLAHIDVVAEDDDLKLPVHLLQGRGFIKSTLNDPDHFLPRFTTINWGICLPAACSYEDAGSIVKNFVKPYNTTGIKLFLEIEEGNCHVRQTSTWTKLFKENWRLVASLGFYTFIVVVTVVASLNDFGVIQIEPHPKVPTAQKSTNENAEESTTPNEEPNLLHQTLMSFSVKRTFRQLMGGEDETLAGKDVVGCLSGLRALATIALFCALRLIPMGFQPFTNRNEFTESFNTPWSVALRVLMLYADVYLVISGFLAAYHMVGEYQQKQKVAWFRRIVGRYLRLTLPLIPVLIFYSVVWEHLGNGPQWGDVVVKNADLCKHNFWKNILFVQNWYPVEESCAPHTFQLAVEMQLAILAPLLLIILTANPFYGIGAFVLLHGLSTAMRFTSTTEDRLSPYIYHGIRLTQIYRTVNLSFSETLHRATPYLAGFGLGYLLREGDIRKQVDRGIRMSGWIGTAIALGWCFVFPLGTAEKEFQYDINDAAQYAALAPLSWALSICWVIYFCETHQASLLNRLLSCRMMTFLSKISYSVSLIQFLVFFYFAGSTRGSEVFSWSGYLNRTEIFLLIFGGTLLTVLYDLPIQNIKAMLDRSGVFDRMEKKDNSVVVLTPPKEEGQEEVTQNGTEKPVENGSAASHDEKKEESKKAEDDFVSPFDDRDDDFVPRQAWKRKTPEPEQKPPSPTKGFWDDQDESDAPKSAFKAPSPTKTNMEQVSEEEEEIEEIEVEEVEEEVEEEEEEEDEEEIDEEKEVLHRPTGAQSTEEEVKPEPEKPEPKTTATTTSSYSRSSSYSPPYVRRQWRRTWDD